VRACGSTSVGVRSPQARTGFGLVSAPLSILHADNHLVAVAKPACLPTVPDASGDESLFDLVREWVRETYAKPGAAWLGVVHRLDRPVSGVVVFARTSKGAARLSAQIARHAVTKVYWGIGRGRPREERGEIVQWLVKDEVKNRVRDVGGAQDGAREARTRWRVLSAGPDETLYELEPVTGRSHQLRLALASLGTPLLGDLKYGAETPLADRSIALHARRLELAHPTRDERLEFVAPLPELACWALARAPD